MPMLGRQFASMPAKGTPPKSPRTARRRVARFAGVKRAQAVERRAAYMRRRIPKATMVPPRMRPY